MSKRQVSKRNRNRQKLLETMPTFDARSGTPLDNRLWIYRRVERASLDGLKKALENIKNSEAARKRGNYTLSLMYPAEVWRATRGSGLKGFIGVQGIANALNPVLPESLKEPKIATVQGLRQYQNRIGLHVDYPGLEDEREIITSALNQILGINYKWNIGYAHISVAKGHLAQLSNVAVLEQALPENLNLSIAEEAFNQ